MPGMFRKTVAAALASAGLLLAPATALAQSHGKTGVDYTVVQDYEPTPAVWRLADEDTTIYMLGTIHLLPPGFRWRNAQIDAILDEAQELVVESSDADGLDQFEAIMPKLARFMDDRKPTSEQLAPDVRGKWRRLARLTDTHFAEVDNLPVTIAMISFGREGDAGSPASYDFGVETVLEDEFASRGLPVRSIEDAGEVLYGLYREDDAKMIAELERELRRWDGKRSADFFRSSELPVAGDFWWMENAWARGEIDGDFDLGLPGSGIGDALNDVLIVRRNTRWAAWLDDRLDRPGTILLAVGAGHFMGDESLLVELRERGLEAERIH